MLAPSLKYFQFILLLMLLMATSSYAQSVGINLDGSSSAMLDVKATNKGMILPRMDSTQRNAIVNPAEGLMIYNTHKKKTNVYNGSAWKNIDGTTACLFNDRRSKGLLFT